MSPGGFGVPEPALRSRFRSSGVGGGGGGSSGRLPVQRGLRAGQRGQRRREARGVHHAARRLPHAAGGLHAHDPGRGDGLLPEPGGLRGLGSADHPPDLAGGAEVRFRHR